MTSLADEAWFKDFRLQRVFALLNADGGEGRVVGGAVRNSLMGLPVSDIDIATTLTPDAVTERAKASGSKAIPTGIEHGTVTLVIEGKPFEVTTLRTDVETDGRRAKVAFSTDWQADAERRDLTINALYMNSKGEVVDLVGGLGDIEKRNIRFIGDAATRIAEDYLRILRFFRFFCSLRLRPARCRRTAGLFGGAFEARYTFVRKGLVRTSQAACCRRSGPGAALDAAGFRCSAKSCRRRRNGASTPSRDWSLPKRRSAGSPIRFCGSLRSFRPMPKGWRRWRSA